MKDKKKKNGVKKITRMKDSTTNQKIQGFTNRPIKKKILKVAVKDALTSPRTGIWSPLIKAIINYYKMQIPGYSASKDMADILEKTLQERDPEVFAEIQTRLDR